MVKIARVRPTITGCAGEAGESPKPDSRVTPYPRRICRVAGVQLRVVVARGYAAVV